MYNLRIIIVPASMQDPELWDQPEVFNPDPFDDPKNKSGINFSPLEDYGAVTRPLSEENPWLT